MDKGKQQKKLNLSAPTMRIAEFKELYSNFQGRKRGAVFQQRGLRMDQTMEFGKFLRCIVVHQSKTNSELFN